MKCKLCDTWTRRGDLCRDCRMVEKQNELDALTEYFGEIVAPLSVVCDAIVDWARCIQQGDTEHGKEYTQHLDHIIMDIRKSGLMNRLVYWGEKVRTEKCPVHQGKMDTCLWALGVSPIPDGCLCDGSGWIPVETKKTQRDS